MGAVGGGGLGDLSIRFGYQHFTPEIMAAPVTIVLVVLVQIIQLLLAAGWRAAQPIAGMETFRLSRSPGFGKPRQLCSPSCSSSKNMIGRVNSSENFRP